MPKPKKKTLPKDFDALLKAGDMAALTAVFDACERDARGGYGKQTALAFNDAPEALIRWLVEQGADLEATNTWGRTPLHEHAGSWNGKVEVLLDLGADIHATDPSGDTPLHKAATSAKPEAVRILLARGARADAVNRAGLTPLAAGLQACSNAQIEAMAEIAALLLAAEPPLATPGLFDRIRRAVSGGGGAARPGPAEHRAFVQRIGENFEFHRAGFNPEFLQQTSDGLDRLYALFDLPPVARRRMHDGAGPIVATPGRWQDQHQELWALLVPSSGAAATVQGEVIRIAGRIADEIDRNGGANWDADYRRMGKAFLAHIASGAPLSDADQARAAELIQRARTLDGVGEGLCELSVRWVALNPAPVAPGATDYAR
ncbi:MAG: ankyrin repeat domain-containing protein [Caulobacteraceae bacterium]|nr:MAG: ankyrin repeat domain-containing protein [Caulobacteraceae bacterium]